MEKLLMEPLRVRQGSVKNILIFKEPKPNSPGQGIFEFLDYFSVFDWGRFSKDPIEFKGVAMAAIAKKYFELLEKEGIKTHYRGMSNLNKMKIVLVNIPEAYKKVEPNTRNYLLPIEIIFRNYIHPQSSDLKKIKEGKITFQKLGYEEMPEANKKLSKPKISYSTKLEETDRLLTKEEARILAGLTGKEMEELEKLALKVNEIISDHSEKAGLIHYDGKIEVAKDINGDFMVVDVVGSLDEDRFMMEIKKGKYVDISKQFIRDWFIAQGWKKVVDEAKKKAKEKKERNWKIFCQEPPKLPKKIKKLLTQMYLADAKTRAGERLEKNLAVKIYPLKEIAKKMYLCLNPTFEFKQIQLLKFI